MKKLSFKELEERVKSLEKKAERCDRAEAALKEAEAWLQFMLATNPAVTYTCEPHGQYAATFVSPEVESQLGYKPNAFTEDPNFWADHIHPEDRAHVLSGLAQLFQRGHHLHEYRFQRKDGTYRWMRDQVKLIRGKKGKPTTIVGYWIDITDRREMEEALTVRASAMASSTNAIALADLEGHLTYVNDAFLKLWGYGYGEDVLGKRVAIFWESRERVKDLLNALRTEGHWSGEMVAKVKDGSRKDVQLSASLVRDQSGRPLCLMGWFVDVTERNKMDRELKERKAALESRTRELEEVNSALRVLLKQRDEDKTEIAEQILLNVKDLVIPYVGKLKKALSGTKELAYLNILESNLNDIISPFPRKLSLKYSSLTQTEMQIAHLVKEGKTTREMAQLLDVSQRTIESHRQKIRTKVGIKNNKANLRSYLMAVQ